ncbi:Cof-type HAD-IIB family hydrolase [Mesoplasma seiffertii]|uniref:Cof-type HAD-IIB family hydrolase n=1 Tax=Mesoplasma seiffertii TaxID=28224 RepID=UPI00047DF40E|nr:Cof-type HAD-IIB family hydrolase [Mesoplasma seiffertii]
MKLKNLDRKRLIMIDLDGTTLMNKDDKIHPLTKSALMKASADGHKVCIVTGRPFRAIKHIYEELELTTLLCNFDGAHIHDPYKKEFKRIVLAINNEIIQAIINEPNIANSVENILIEYYDKTLIWKEDKDLDEFFHLSDLRDSLNEPLIVGSPYTEWKGPSTNIVLKLKDNSYKNRVLRVLGKYQDAVKIQSDILYGVVSTSEKPVITLTNKNASKGFAADILAQYYNQDLRDVVAFGDQLNDFEMIQKVGHGVAMKNGADALKFVANGITYKTNDEGGLGQYLEQLLIGNEM